MATKKAAKAKNKTVTKKKTAAKAATAKTKKAAPKKAAAKKAVKKAAPAKKQASVKKPAARKAAPAKKKAAPAKKKAAPAKKPATKKTTAKKPSPAKAVKKTTAKKTTAKTAAKKAASKKLTAKAIKKALEAAKPKPKPGSVGQAPRKTARAASIPTPTTIQPKETPQADAKASQNAEASSSAKQNFRLNDKIVYPAHGVGKIVGLEKQQVAGISIELFVINFDQEKMKLRVPTGKAKSAGMRALSGDKVIKNAINTLKGRARVKRTMWSRRAQEYDAKINSGDIILVAEVVRDLFRAEDQPEQSYSERQLFEAALDRMAREVAAVKKVGLSAALEELDATLQKKAAAAAAAAEAAAEAAAAAAAVA